ncbi:MAG TPA: hypothetical protein VLL54_16900 [Pyrinomonadaceae bacterium]|nr:hypothetical protein [Pyrinomonadaceae bacterium]
MDTLTNTNNLPDNLPEVPARSSLPWVWFGFFFVAAFFIEEVLMFVLELDVAVSRLVLLMIGIAGWIFWLFCVARFHTILEQISRKKYPISNYEAVGKHFIPLYNLYWVFRWPAAISEYLNQRGRVQMVSGYWLGLVLFPSILISRFFDGGIGLAGTFLVGLYISAKLNTHLQLIQGGPVPPIPDPSMFRATSPVQPAAATASQTAAIDGR